MHKTRDCFAGPGLRFTMEVDEARHPSARCGGSGGEDQDRRTEESPDL
jgi:hypothetical protein